MDFTKMTALSAFLSSPCQVRKPIPATATLWLAAWISWVLLLARTCRPTSPQFLSANLTSSHPLLTLWTHGSSSKKSKSKYPHLKASVRPSPQLMATIQSKTEIGTKNSRPLKLSIRIRTWTECRKTAPTWKCTKTLPTHPSLELRL